MSIATEASKLLTNKYFLYFMVFLAATNVIGYLVTNKINAVIFFALVSLLTYQFSKNMAVILLVAIISTNFLMANKKMREGLENATPNTTTSPATSPATEKIDGVDQQIADTLPIVQEAKNNDEVSAQLKNNNHPVATTVGNASSEGKRQGPGKIVDPNNPDKNTTTDNEEVEGFGDRMGGRKGTNNNVGPRLDYAATIEQSYANLDQILGSDSINKLTGDTQKLMAQQQKLFDTMQNMVPVLQGAQNLLKDFKIEGLADSLKSIGGVANIQLPGTNKN
jgi:hypothetical protein